MASDYVRQQIQTKAYQLIILDEVSHALNKGFLQLTQLQELLELDISLNWILTGRSMPEELMSRADFWWDLNLVKHPFAQGIHSRRGIEY